MSSISAASSRVPGRCLRSLPRFTRPGEALTQGQTYTVTYDRIDGTATDGVVDTTVGSILRTRVSAIAPNSDAAHDPEQEAGLVECLVHLAGMLVAGGQAMPQVFR